ncbi:MAG TPA: hypothetical protein PLR99_05205 [Polyangiaceae bacterium]|jgi:hypothetical protein|nr:hypothetical protein [Polyangiaceae bacterium]
MSHRSSLIAVLFLVVSLVLAGCAKPWVVVSQANPNPMAATSRFSVTKLTFDNLQVGTKSDKEYAEEKESKTADAWQGDKVEMTQAFATAFLDAQAPLQTGDGGDFVVKVNCAYIEPGFYAYVASAPADIRIRATILNKAGAVVDEIELRTSSSDMAKRTRLRNAARSAGAGLAKYLHERLSL